MIYSIAASILSTTIDWSNKIKVWSMDGDWVPPVTAILIGWPIFPNPISCFSQTDLSASEIDSWFHSDLFRASTTSFRGKRIAFFRNLSAEASADKFLKKAILFPLKDVVDALKRSEWNQESISEALKSVCEKHEIGFGKIGQPIRIAVTGGTQSPSIDQTLILLDQSIVVDRIEAAIEYIIENSN